jgi:hypothetical protein
LHDHHISLLDLSICTTVGHCSLIYTDVVFVADSRNMLLVNCVPLSVTIEFDTPKWWMMLVMNFTACSEVILVIGHT